MITGDRWSPARRVAEALGITDFTAEALPGDKLELVEQLKAEGHTVAVVGDGVNDGPALAAGDVSLAMGAAGSDVAINSASIALMNNNLNRIPFMVGLSKKTVAVIRQNLVGTMIYILAMIALLLAGWMVPWVAAVGHGISSIIVIFNSARLVREGEDLHTPDTTVETGRRARKLEHVGTPAAAPATA
jgi:Cd2+/Zn2+-exporting ATPase